MQISLCLRIIMIIIMIPTNLVYQSFNPSFKNNFRKKQKTKIVEIHSCNVTNDNILWATLHIFMPFGFQLYSLCLSPFRLPLSETEPSVIYTNFHLKNFNLYSIGMKWILNEWML